MTPEAVGIAINEAAEQLPEGWNLCIDVEKGSAVVLLRDAEGDSVDTDKFEDDADLAEEIRNAVAYAQACSRKGLA